MRWIPGNRNVIYEKVQTSSACILSVLNHTFLSFLLFPLLPDFSEDSSLFALFESLDRSSETFVFCKSTFNFSAQSHNFAISSYEWVRWYLPSRESILRKFLSEDECFSELEENLTNFKIDNEGRYNIILIYIYDDWNFRIAVEMNFFYSFFHFSFLDERIHSAVLSH